MLIIMADTDPQQARDLCAGYADDIARAGELAVEFDHGAPNIFAQQIALSCRRSLLQAGRFAGFGPVAQRALGQILKTETV